MADATLPPLVDDLRCAPQAVELGLDPAGTATGCTTLVLVEHGGAWPARIEELDLIAGVPPLGGDHRILAVRGPEAQAMPSLTVWRAGADLRFAGTDYEAMPDRLPEALAALADGGSPEEADGVMTIGPAPPEVLVCGHGRRDTCCGNFGIRLLAQVEQLLGQGAWPGLRARRCSHTGGHRFAPTGITLPEGRMWAFLDLDLLDAAVTGRAEPDLARSNRGLMALDPLAQVAEAALWDHLGPTWRSNRPTVETLTDGRPDPAPPDTTGYRFTWTAGDQHHQATVSVRRSGSAPVPACGQPIDQAVKTSPTFEVVSIDLG